MGKRFNNRNDSGSLLASIFILALGGGTSLFTVAAMSPSSLPKAMWTVGGIVSAFMVFIILHRMGKVPQADLSFLLASHRNRRCDGTTDYQPRKLDEGRKNVIGTNQPISAEEARDIKQTSSNTWVPSPTRGKKKK